VNKILVKTTNTGAENVRKLSVVNWPVVGIRKVQFIGSVKNVPKVLRV